MGVPFHTPEPFFLGEAECAKWDWLSLNANEYVRDFEAKQKESAATAGKDDDKSWYHGTLPIAKSDSLEMVIMRGV